MEQPTETVNPASTRRDYLLLALLGALALLPGIWRGLTVDEYTTWARSALLPLQDLIEDRLRNGHFPTYFIFMKGWIALTGSAEAVLRLPSALMTLAALLAFRALMGDLFGRRTANLASVVFALHQVVLWSGQTARPYAGMLLCGVAAAWGLVRWWRGGRKFWLAVVAGSVAIGFLFQAAFALTPAALAVAVLFGVRGAGRRAAASLAALLLPLALLSVPGAILARSQQKFQPEVKKARKVKLGGVASSLGNVAFGTLDTWAGNGWRYPAAALFVGMTVAAARQGRRRSAQEEGENVSEPALSLPVAQPLFPARALLWCWCFLPIAALVVTQQVTGNSILSHERYFVPALGGLIGLIGLGLRGAERLPALARVPYLPFALVLAVVGANAAAYWMSDGDGPKEVAAAMKSVRSGLPIATTDAAPVAYEFRQDKTLLIKLDQLSLPEATAKLAGRGAPEPLWVFIYNNKSDPLDPLLETPVPGYTIAKRLDHASARAALLLPSGTDSPD